EKAEPRIAVALVVEVEQHKAVPHQIVVAIGEQALPDEAGLEIAARANTEHALAQQPLEAFDDILLGAFRIDLEEVRHDTETREQIIARFGFDLEDLLDLGLTGLQMPEALRGEVGLQTRAEAAVLEKMEVALPLLLVERCLENFV